MAIRPFIDTLRELRQGQVLDELGERLNEVVAGVRESGKAGTLTLTIKVKPASRGNVDTLFLEDQVKAVVPKMERGATVFFSTPENNLTRQDPRQLEMDTLRVVSDDNASQPLKQVN